MVALMQTKIAFEKNANELASRIFKVFENYANPREARNELAFPLIDIEGNQDDEQALAYKLVNVSNWREALESSLPEDGTVLPLSLIHI